MKGALRKLWAWLNRWFHWIALVGVVIGLVIAVKSQWAAITELDWEGSWKTLLLSAICFSAAPLAQAATFWIILRLLNARAPFGEAMVIWARSSRCSRRATVAAPRRGSRSRPGWQRRWVRRSLSP